MKLLAIIIATVLTLASRTQAFQPSVRVPAAKRNVPTARKAFAVDASVVEEAVVASPSMINAAQSMLSTFFQTQPYLAAFLTCSFKASSADFLAQHQPAAQPTTEQQPSQQQQQVDAAPKQPIDLDMSRNLAFLLYGGLYQGLAQQYMYTNVFPAWFGSDHSWHTVAVQVGFDMAVIGPFLCLPIAYIVKSLFSMSGDDSSQDVLQRYQHQVMDGIDKYVSDVTERGLLYKYWALWIPVQSVTFGVIPPHFRVAFVACVSFIWVIILSSVSAQAAAEEATEQQQLPARVQNSSSIRATGTLAPARANST